MVYLYFRIKELCNLSRSRDTPKELLNIKNTVTESLDEVNGFFTSVGTNLAKVILQKLGTNESILAQKAKLTDAPLNSMALYLSDPDEVINIISSLKTHSAPGIDKITTFMLKTFRYSLAEPLSYLINLSFECGVFPKIFKCAVVCPVYKSGDKSLTTNYRPISLISTISKVMEKIMNKRIINFLESNKLLSENQYGFRTNRSTDDAVLRLTTRITAHVDNNDKCVGIFLDLQKAFDTVSIPILLSRLENLGIRGTALLWLKDYLTRREQCVRVENQYSNYSSGSYGVPQGSTLGPTLFLAYINDLCKLNIKGADIQMFADDTVILFHSNTWEKVQLLAEEGMSEVTSWLEDSLLSLNVDKTKVLCFSKTSTSSPRNFQLRTHSFPCNRSMNTDTARSHCSCPMLARATVIKYLGINIDDKLTWKVHVTSVSNRLRKLIFIFKELRLIEDNTFLIQTYKALAECVITYCICSWGSANKSHLLELERAQRAVLKVLFYLPFRHPSHLLYKKAEVLAVRKLYIYQCIRKYHRKTVPLLLPSARRIDICPVPRVNSKFAQNHYSHVAPRIYNKLNLTYKTKHLSNYQIKQKIKLWLKDLTYADVEHLLLIIK